MLAHKEKEFDFSEQDFQKLRALVKQFTGISMSNEKHELLYGRIARRMRALNMHAFSTYISLLEHNPAGEKQHFINAVTTNLTSFFREMHHFTYLKDRFLPEFLLNQAKKRPLRIWSAGCSSGEEPYSIMMTVGDVVGDPERVNLHIQATDIDTGMVQAASEGIYDRDRVDGLPEATLKKYFLRGTGNMSHLVRFMPTYRKYMDFSQLNLMESWPTKQAFDVIFCRNVAIYFDKKTQSDVYSRFHQSLVDDGLLIIGHSESLYNLTDKFEMIGKTIYKKS